MSKWSHGESHARSKKAQKGGGGGAEETRDTARKHTFLQTESSDKSRVGGPKRATDCAGGRNPQACTAKSGLSTNRQ